MATMDTFTFKKNISRKDRHLPNLFFLGDDFNNCLRDIDFVIKTIFRIIENDAE